jgi:hypothetical protein
MQWKIQNPLRPKFDAMVVCFFDHKAIVYYEFIVQAQTVERQCYLEWLTKLRNLFGGRVPKSGLSNGFSTMILPPARDVLRVREFLPEKSITRMDYPLYSPDLTPCEFWLFPELKNGRKGQIFANIPDIQCNVTLLRGIPENDFQDSRSALRHKESIFKATAAASAQESIFLSFPLKFRTMNVTKRVTDEPHVDLHPRRPIIPVRCSRAQFSVP